MVTDELAGQPGQAAASRHPGLITLLLVLPVVLLSVLFLMVAVSYFWPHIDLPVVSQLGCSLRDGTWYSGCSSS